MVLNSQLKNLKRYNRAKKTPESSELQLTDFSVEYILKKLIYVILN